MTEKCAVCQKPICSRCMESFGYFCSPLCKNKADMQGMDVPVYAGQKFEVEAQFWRKTGLIFGGVLGVLALLLGVWVWYSWFGSVPHKYFAVRFENDPAYSGKSMIVGKDQIIFLHGGTLARYDLKTKKQVWSQELVTQKQVDDVVKEEMDSYNRANAASVGDEYHPRPMNPAEVAKEARMGLEAALLLRVSGQNVWVGNGNKLTHYDWDSGKVLGDTTLPEMGDALIEGDGELLMLGEQSVTHISLANGESRVEQFHQAGPAAHGSTGNTATGGLALSGAASGKPLDPDKVAAQAQNLKLPGRIALPALLANAQHEKQLEDALNDTGQHRHLMDPDQPGAENFQLIPGPNGYVQFSSVLLEHKTITRTAMKAAPKKSALDGDVNASRTMDVANEILNEQQRNNGGDSVEEDASRYRVTVHIPDAAGTSNWVGEVVGEPQLFPLKTVNVIAAGKTVIVLDKSNNKLWQATLTYAVPGGGGLFQGESQFGAGPCVEHGDTLYVFDQAVLSAFELGTGNARWRLPSVGVVGLFFDDQNMVYVNTTSGNPDDIKYSRQIDVNKRTDDILMKVDPKTGKTLWSVKPGGFISYLSGKYIYTVQSYDPNPDDHEVLSDTMAGLEKPAYFRIARVNPKNGRIMWEYYDALPRCPFDIRFKENTIQLMFKKEVQVLKYLTF